MMVSEKLWVGVGPDTPSFGIVVQCATAEQAKEAMGDANTAVVPTTDVARDTLLLLGVGEAWATYATQGTPVERDVTVDL